MTLVECVAQGTGLVSTPWISNTYLIISLIMIVMNIIKESMATAAKGEARWRRGRCFSVHRRARLLRANPDKRLQVQRLPEPPYQPRRCPGGLPAAAMSGESPWKAGSPEAAGNVSWRNKVCLKSGAWCKLGAGEGAPQRVQRNSLLHSYFRHRYYFPWLPHTLALYRALYTTNAKTVPSPSFIAG